jgi:hypothetical protein
MTCVLVMAADESLGRRLLWILREAGHDGRWDGDDLEGAVPDVALVANAPGGGVRGALSRLQLRWPALRIIDLSHQCEGQPEIEADACLRQPFHADELLEVIDRVTRESRITRMYPRHRPARRATNRHTRRQTFG